MLGFVRALPHLRIRVEIVRLTRPCAAQSPDAPVTRITTICKPLCKRTPHNATARDITSTAADRSACGSGRTLAPLRDELRRAVAILVGVESMIVLRDVLGLEHDEARDVGEWAVRELVRARLLEAIHAEAEGNPLFVAEVVRMLAGEGRWPSRTRCHESP